MNDHDIQDALNINHHGVLKPPALLWVMLLFETRHWWLSVFIAFSGQTWLFAETYTLFKMAAEVPALMLLIALSRRQPGAHAIFRWLWNHGRVLLTLTALVSAAAILNDWLQSEYWVVDNEISAIGTLSIHIWILARLWINSALKRVFAEFPNKAPLKINTQH